MSRTQKQNVETDEKLVRIKRGRNCLTLLGLQSIYFPLLKAKDSEIKKLFLTKKKLDLEMKEIKEKYYLITKKIKEDTIESIEAKSELIKEYKKIKKEVFKND